MKLVTVRAAKTRLSRRIEDVVSGEQVSIARGKEPGTRRGRIATPSTAC